MPLNPLALMKLAGLRKKFQENHPKMVAFLKSQIAPGLPEGTILEISVTRPGEEKVTANIKVNETDTELMRELWDALH